MAYIGPATPSGVRDHIQWAHIPYLLPTTTTMAARVVHLDELATLIATHLVTISPRSAPALAQTCRALEVPALRALWGIQHSIQLLIESVLPMDTCCYTTKARTELFLIVGHLFSSPWDPVCSVTNRSCDGRSLRGS